MLQKLVKAYPIFTLATVLLLAGLFSWLFQFHSLANFFFLTTIVFGGFPLVLHTLRSLLSRNYSADVIAALAILTSLILKEYFAGAIIVIMLSGGEALESFALRSASKALEELAKLAPSVAHLVADETIEDVEVERVKKNDIVLVKPGELVPVDGVVIEGESSFNEAALTGESVPVSKVSSSTILSGTVNLDSPVKIKALRRAKESKYEQIVTLVRTAQKTKAPIHRLADRYAAFFTPLTLGIVALTFLLTQDWTNVLAVLVVATPCPLILATPIAIMGGINKAARNGIIVKNGGALEQVGEAKAIVFDKTGTLTFGTPKVLEIKKLSQLSEKEILFLAASAERLSAHILAKALVSFSTDKHLKLDFPDNFEEKFGSGVMGEIKGKKVVVGSSHFLEEKEQIFPSKLQHLKEQENSKGHMTSFVSVDGSIVGAIIFGDEIRPEIRGFIDSLKKHSFAKVSMLTGDSQTVAEQVAAQTGIDEVISQSLPEDKVNYIKKLQKLYQKVVMVGDGFNDAPALASATVGIALGSGGSSVSSESADIVLIVNDLTKVRTIVALGRQVLRVAKSGILFGMGASFIAMLFAAAGYISPPLGAVLQEGIDVVVIFNALRTSR